MSKKSDCGFDFFHEVQPSPPDPIFGLNDAFKADARSEKVNLGMGVYKTDSLQPFILNTIKKAEEILIVKEKSKDYLPIAGLDDYIKQTQLLVFGATLGQERIYGAQTVGATAALRVGGAFLREIGYSKCYLSNPTWVNHLNIFEQAGFELERYPFLDEAKLEFDCEVLLRTLDQAPSGSVVLLQTSCQNPTGIDATLEQWDQIFQKLEEKHLFPFFDFPYQGFGDDLVSDAAALRLFMQRGTPCAISVSHSKNFGLYAERCGALFFVCQDQRQAEIVGSRVNHIIRGIYSNPPCHGGRLVAEILSSPELIGEWEQEVLTMRSRIRRMRLELFKRLQAKSSSRSFEFMARQRGMFSYTGLQKVEVARLISEFGIYLPDCGRINVAGLNAQNIDYVSDAILKVTHR